VECEKYAVEKQIFQNFQAYPVENNKIFHNYLWKKNPLFSMSFLIFPHNFLLLPTASIFILSFSYKE